MKNMVLDAFNYVFPDGHGEVHAEVLKAVNRLPHRTTLQRALVRLDCVSMLACREQWQALHTTPVSLYLSSDSSPQNGVDIFNAWLKMGDLAAMRFTARRLPLVTLGMHKGGAADKLQCLLHQLWLEFGPDYASMRRCLRSVRQVMSDMGT